MFLYPKVAQATLGQAFTSNGNTFQFRDPEERSTKTLVKVKDGETVIIGGLIRNDFTQTIVKIPILGDLPVLGALFRHKGGDTDGNRERELLIFITPHIIKDGDTKLAKSKIQASVQTTAIPEREQSTVLGFSRESIISSSLNNFERK